MTFTKLPKAITAEELLSTPLPPVKWIIPGLLPAGLALFAGPSKAGKSWLTLWLCLQVAQGKPVWGREIEPRTVLYLSLEDTLNRLQDRLFRLVGSEDTPEKLILQTECQSIGQGLEEQITSFLYNHEETVKKLITAFEGQSMKYETYFKLVLATGLRRGEACGLKWSDINWHKRTIHVQRGVVKLSHQESITKDPKTTSGDRIVYLSMEMCQLLKAWRKECEWDRQQTADETVSEDDYLFRQPNGKPMNPSTFTFRFKKILKQNGLPSELNLHSLRHPYVKHTTKIFSLRLMNFQAQAYPDARRKTRGACQLHRGGQSKSLVRLLCNRKQFSCLPPQSKISRILYAISIRLSGYTSTRSISSSASSVVSVSASKSALDASLRLSCRACSSCFCFACANTAA